MTSFSASLLASDENTPQPAPMAVEEPATPNSIDPELMAQAVKNMIAEQERKDNFWLFLEDNPRMMGLVLGAFLILFFALKKQVDEMEIEDVWSKLRKKTIKALLFFTLIILSIYFAVPYLAGI
jgi:hypothetical protein